MSAEAGQQQTLRAPSATLQPATAGAPEASAGASQACRRGLLYGLAAAVAAALPGAALCEAPAASAQSELQARLADAWLDISEDLDRAEAGFGIVPQLTQRCVPCAAPASRNRARLTAVHVRRPQPPRVSVREGRLTVRFPVREGVDFRPALHALMSAMAPSTPADLGKAGLNGLCAGTGRCRQATDGSPSRCRRASALSPSGSRTRGCRRCSTCRPTAAAPPAWSSALRAQPARQVVGSAALAVACARLHAGCVRMNKHAAPQPA